MTEFIDPAVFETFRENKTGPMVCFVSRGIGMSQYNTYIVAPPYVIASVARKRVAADAELDTSWIAPGQETDFFEELEECYGWYDRDVLISSKRSGQLAEMGRQILALNEQGSIQLP